MRVIISGLLVWLGVAGITYAGDFEGVIHMKMTMPGRSMDMNIYSKGDKSRVEPQGLGGAAPIIINDMEARKQVMMMPERKMFMESSLKEEAQKAMEQPTHNDDVTFTKTGKTDTVAGYACEIYLGKKKNGDVETEACMAKGLGDYLGSMGMNRPGAAERYHDMPGWIKDLFKQGLFAVRMITRKDGMEMVRMEATKIERKKLEESLFAVPADYSKFDMSGMGGGKGGLGTRGTMPKPGGGKGDE